MLLARDRTLPMTNATSPGRQPDSAPIMVSSSTSRNFSSSSRLPPCSDHASPIPRVALIAVPGVGLKALPGVGGKNGYPLRYRAVGHTYGQ